MSDTQLTSDQDLMVAGLVVVLALIAFIAVLLLNRSEQTQKKQSEVGSAATAGTVLQEVDGKVVRRSTRRVTW